MVKNNKIWISSILQFLIAAKEGASLPAKPPLSQWATWTSHSPLFLDSPENVSGIVGQTAYLPCRVQNLGDRSVTWMRQRDLHILTAGIFTYSADNRFTVLHPESTNEWNLKIYPAIRRDSGVYECQVNSDPKISRRIQLNILAEDNLLNVPILLTKTTVALPTTEIEGPQECHIQEGSVLSLTCIVRHLPRHPPNHLLWFREQDPLDYDSPRGGVSVQTEKQITQTVSKLSVSSVTPRDSGEYTCSPTDLRPFAVRVHVQSEQHHAAIYQGGIPTSCSLRVKFSIELAMQVLVMIKTYDLLYSMKQ